jgi:hypothetical protein
VVAVNERDPKEAGQSERTVCPIKRNVFY